MTLKRSRCLKQVFVVAGIGNPLICRRKLELIDLIDECWTLPPPESYPGAYCQAFQPAIWVIRGRV